MTILGCTPLRSNVQGWNCVEWVREAFETIVKRDDVIGRGVKSWQSVRDTAIWYVEKKRDEGRFSIQFDPLKVPTWDSLSSIDVGSQAQVPLVLAPGGD